MLYILYYRIFCYPMGQPKLSVATTDGLVLWYWYFKYSCINKHTWICMKMHEMCMNMNKLCMNTNKFALTHMKVDQNFRVCSRYLGHVTSVWNRQVLWQCLKTLLFYSKYVKFIYKYHHYIHCSIYLYAPAPSLKKCNFCYEQIYLSLAGKGIIFQVDIIINGLYIKCSSQVCVFFTFLNNLTIFITVT